MQALILLISSAIATDWECHRSDAWSTFRVNRPLRVEEAAHLLNLNDYRNCTLGWITACIIVPECKFEDVLSSTPVMKLINSDWPILELLNARWTADHQTTQLTRDCENVYHPSFNWSKFLDQSIAAVTQGGSERWNALFRATNDVVWKSVSDAVHSSGLTIGNYTNQCFPGVSVAQIVRLWGILSSPHGDTERIAEHLFRYVQVWFRSPWSMMSTDWPIISLTLLLKQTRYFRPPRAVTLPSMIGSEKRLRLIIIDSGNEATYSIERSDMQNVWLPLSPDALSTCLNSAEAICLDFVSPNPFVAKIMTVKSLLQLPSVEEVIITEESSDGFHAAFTTTEGDLKLFKEPYSDFYACTYMHVRNTERIRSLFVIAAAWIDDYPFATEREGMIYLLHHSDNYSPGPQYSFIPPIEQLPTVVVEPLERDIKTELIRRRNAREPRLELVSLNASLFATPANYSKCVENKFQDNIPESVSLDFNSTNIEFNSSSYLTHISFADGCCGEDQARCTDSAIGFGGANISIPLNGTFLDEIFRARNRDILEFDRRNTSQGKTPSASFGYYVWKPYVILKSLLDPSYPAGSFLVYTDAGMVFTASMRPLLEKYFAVSDIVGLQSVMMEGRVTKRDTFLALQVDDISAALTNQIASCFIAVRKTERTIAFFRWWLAACGCPEVIAETPSEFGVPDYDGYRFHNDDQSAFSLLMKKFGYLSIAHGEMGTFIEARRNKAKFIRSANEYALNNKPATFEEYSSAADG